MTEQNSEKCYFCEEVFTEEEPAVHVIDPTGLASVLDQAAHEECAAQAGWKEV